MSQCFKSLTLSKFRQTILDWEWWGLSRSFINLTKWCERRVTCQQLIGDIKHTWKNTKFFHVCYYGSSKGWKPLYNTVVYMIYCTHFEITGGPCNLIGSHWCDLFTNHTNFCFKLHLFPSQWGGSAKHIITDQISKRVSCDKFCNFCFQNSYSPSPPKMDEFNFKLAQYCINEIFELCESYLGDFKMDVIKWWLNLVWRNFGLKSYLLFQIELALGARSIMKSNICFQPKLHSTEFNYHYKQYFEI